MKKYINWYYLHLKVKIKTPSVYIQLLSMILIVFLISNTLIPTNEMVNVLESVSIPLYPEIGEIKKTMQELGAVNAIMSGSGFLVAPPDAGARMAAQSASQNIFTSSRSSRDPVLLIKF